jgi:hypothetical protein
VTDAVLAMILVEMKDDLDVGSGAEAVSGLDQAPAEFRAVVDLAIAD